jgi:predicted  nucleic acid-binding Zn-ribbon protein
MSKIDPLALAGKKSKGRRPYFLDTDIERLTNIVLVLTQELAVVRERADTLERLLEASGAVTRDQIEGFTPTKEQANERGAWMQEYLARVFRVLQQEREAATLVDEPSSAEIADELAQV